jgi:hypothetical protein
MAPNSAAGQLNVCRNVNVPKSIDTTAAATRINAQRIGSGLGANGDGDIGTTP